MTLARCGENRTGRLPEYDIDFIAGRINWMLVAANYFLHDLSAAGEGEENEKATETAEAWQEFAVRGLRFAPKIMGIRRAVMEASRIKPAKCIDALRVFDKIFVNIPCSGYLFLKSIYLSRIANGVGGVFQNMDWEAEANNMRKEIGGCGMICEDLIKAILTDRLNLERQEFIFKKV